MKKSIQSLLTFLAVLYNLPQKNVIPNIDACMRMKYINPLGIETPDKEKVSLSRKFRAKLGRKIDKLIEIDIQKLKKVKNRKLLKDDLEELMLYGITSPCVVIAILDANLTSMLIGIAPCIHVFILFEGIFHYNPTTLF